MLSGIQIGILVAMLVVFVALASLLIFLILRWNRMRRKREPSDDTDDYTLHFIDYADRRRSISLRQMGITDGYSLRTAIAALCELPDSSSLALVYTNEADRRVEMDLDRLVAHDAALPQRMRQTAARPLALSTTPRAPVPCHAPADTASSTGAALRASSSGAPLGASSSGAPLGASSSGAPLGASSSGAPLGASSSYAALRASSSYAALRASSSGAVEVVVPPPLILPRRARIGAATPVHIVAAQYAADGGAVLAAEDTAALEAAMARGAARRALTLPSGTCVTVDAKAATAWLTDGRELHRCVAEALYYSVDNMSSAQWYAYRKPIHLPPGRWCVRAEASNADHRIVKTSSRVFTVDVVEQH